MITEIYVETFRAVTYEPGDQTLQRIPRDWQGNLPGKIADLIESHGAGTRLRSRGEFESQAAYETWQTERAAAREANLRKPELALGRIALTSAEPTP